MAVAVVSAAGPVVEFEEVEESALALAGTALVQARV
jgi:hypothetical protein